MMNDENGCTMCKELGTERYEYFTLHMPRRNRKEMVQYDYRHTDGELFSCVAQSLEAARSRRDEWLKRR